MKKIILIVAILALSQAVFANSIRFFTYSQAERTVRHLNAQDELMIYCGYDDEIETYVLVNEVWAERYNSQFYEIWLYGYDAYTGDEIYMPIDLGCIWLYNRTGTRMYSAATVLRFRNARPVPHFMWTMPPYRPFHRRPHAPGFLYTYHFDIHQPGWHHPYHGHNPYNYPPYYMRHRHEPAPVHHEPFTPGHEMPRTMTPDGHGYLGNTRGGSPTRTASDPTVRSTSSTMSKTRTTSSTSSPNTIVVSRSTSSTSTSSSSSTSRGSSTTTTTNQGGTTSRGSSATTTTNQGSTTSRGSSTTTNQSGTTSRGSSTTSSTNQSSSSSRGSSTTSSQTSSSSRGTASSSKGTTSTSRGSPTSTSTGSSSSSRSSSTTSTSSSSSRGTSTSTSSSTSSSRGTSSTSTSSRGTSSNNTSSARTGR